MAASAPQRAGDEQLVDDHVAALRSARRPMAKGARGVLPPQMAAQYVTVGEPVPVETGFIKGHGTQMQGGQLVATVCGFVERVNKLVVVRPLHTRYEGSVGDVVVGRVLEIGDKRWRVDINSRQHGVLMLSSAHLPGGVQRRRTEEDALQMRQIFAESDLISAEVQAVLSDGALSLHTRSLKYGRLTNGQFIRAPAALMRRTAQHFQSLPCGVDAIFGNNGYIFVRPTPPRSAALAEAARLGIEEELAAAAAEGGGGGAGAAGGDEKTSPEERERVCRVRNTVVVLARGGVPIYAATVMAVYAKSQELGLAAKDMLREESLAALLVAASAADED